MNLTEKAVEILGQSRLEYALLISTRYRFIYIDNPKTGCSSLKAGLIEHESRIRVICYEGIKVHKRNQIPFKRLSEFKQFDNHDPLTYLINDGYFIFSFVRNPYTRLVSAYCNKILGNKPEKNNY